MTHYHNSRFANLNLKQIYRYCLLRLSGWGRNPVYDYQPGHNDLERKINKLLDVYPDNHNYQLRKGKIVPCFKLYQRIQAVSSSYPKNMDSFLDIACCKGYYVFDAALRFNCNTCIGVDVHEPFVSTADRVRELLDINTKKVAFYHATLEEISDDPQKFGGPFQTLLFLGAYHYFFWGSSYNSKAFYSHREILSRISKLCTERVIFSGRLEIDRLPRYLQEKAKKHNSSVTFNTSHFLTVADEYFHVHKAGYLGKNPLLVMHKRNSHCPTYDSP